MRKEEILEKLPTPCYVVDEAALIHNLEILKSVREKTDCHILLAQKAYSCYRTYPLIAQYLSGTTASGLFEAKLAHEEMGNRQIHVFSPAYKDADFDELLKICDHIVFNSFSQWRHFREKALAHPEIQFGLRINPGYSEIETKIYDPCAENSRLGITLENFMENELDGISGLHFHTMCEQGADTLERTLEVVEKKFGKYIRKMKWLNFGGGHHISKGGYDTEKLIGMVRRIKEEYGVQVYIEPGEAVAINAGFLSRPSLILLKTEWSLRSLIPPPLVICPMYLKCPTARSFSAPEKQAKRNTPTVLEDRPALREISSGIILLTSRFLSEIS